MIFFPLNLSPSFFFNPSLFLKKFFLFIIISNRFSGPFVDTLTIFSFLWTMNIKWPKAQHYVFFELGVFFFKKKVTKKIVPLKKKKKIHWNIKESVLFYVVNLSNYKTTFKIPKSEFQQSKNSKIKNLGDWMLASFSFSFSHYLLGRVEVVKGLL